MTWVEHDRWSCPTCKKTIVIDGSRQDTVAAIAAVQTRHGETHRKAAALSAKLRNTSVDNPAPRWGAA